MPDQNKRRLSWGKIRQLLATPDLEPEHVAERIRFMEQKVVLATKVVCLLALAYLYFLFSNMIQVSFMRENLENENTFGSMGFDTLRTVVLVYLMANVGVLALMISMDRLPLGLVKGVVYVISLIDGVFLSFLVSISGGVESTVFWIYPFLIIRNAISTPSATYQVLLNLIITCTYVLAGLVDQAYGVIKNPAGPDFGTAMAEAMGSIMRSHLGDVLVLRVVLMGAIAAASYAIQVLYEKQRLALLEAREVAARQHQLRSTGRLAAEIAHQLKNPLAIINNAAFNLQRTLKDTKPAVTQQVEMIREEIERADKIITELMGYAQLVEGRVEKLNLVEEIESAIALVFPEGAGFTTEIVRKFAPGLPPLLMTSAHLKEVLVNILKNSREALQGRGTITVTTRPREDQSVEITIADNGPGIPEYQLNQIFEPYFSTKETGTGLGLAIVKHNTELYGGRVRVESELGKGAKFILEFPSKALLPVEP